MEPRRLPIFRAPLRPMLLLGADRTLVLYVGGTCAALPWFVQDLGLAVACAGVWLLSLWGLRRMAKADPYMYDVYRRQIAFARYYPARAGAWARPATQRVERPAAMAKA